MKKIMLLSTTLLMINGAQASIEVWNQDGNKLNANGRVFALNYITDKNKNIDKPEGDNTTARIGFSGQTQVTEMLSGYGRFEWETRTGARSATETRYAYAGISHSTYGAIEYGQSDGIAKFVSAQVDIMPEFPSSPVNNSMYKLSARSEKILTYRNYDFFGVVDGLNFGLQYADTDRDNAKIDRGEAYGIGIEYTIPDSGVTISSTYVRTMETYKEQTWGAGVRYNANNLYAAAIYMENRDDVAAGATEQKVRGFDFIAQYSFGFENGMTLTPSVGYSQHKDKSSGRQNGTLIEHIEIGFALDLNKNLRAIIDYKFNLLDKDDYGALKTAYDRNNVFSSKIADANTKNTLALGVIYQF